MRLTLLITLAFAATAGCFPAPKKISYTPYPIGTVVISVDETYWEIIDCQHIPAGVFGDKWLYSMKRIAAGDFYGGHLTKEYSAESIGEDKCFRPLK